MLGKFIFSHALFGYRHSVFGQCAKNRGTLCNLFMNIFVIIGMCFMISACSHTENGSIPDNSINVADDSQENAVEGAKAIFVSGEGPVFITQKKAPASPSKKIAKKRDDKKEKYMGIAYWIEMLTPDGKRLLTSKNRTFKAGDRIKLNVESNREGFLYIFNVGTTSTTHVLFPPANENNFIEKKRIYSVPYNTYMKFDNNPGEETLMVLLSPNPISNFDTSKLQASYSGSKDILLDEADTNNAKDIVLDDATPASYQYAAPVAGTIVAPLSSLENQGEAITLHIKLKHN